jgi:hypothetical protein
LLSLTLTIYLYFIFSGTPFKNKTYALKLRRLAINYFIWTACCIINAGMSLGGVSARDASESDNLKASLLMFFEYLITEVVPYVLSLELSFV